MQQLELVNSFFDNAWTNPSDGDFMPAILRENYQEQLPPKTKKID
jgi:hypothetical protein